MKRSALKRVSRRKVRITSAYRITKGELAAAANGRCQARILGICTIFGQDLHHVKPRGRGGETIPSTDGMLYVCRSCHSEIHARPRWAREMGFLK